MIVLQSVALNNFYRGNTLLLSFISPGPVDIRVWIGYNSRNLHFLIKAFARLDMMKIR